MSEMTSGLVEPVSKEMQALIDRTRAAMAACFTDRPKVEASYRRAPLPAPPAKDTI